MQPAPWLTVVPSIREWKEWLCPTKKEVALEEAAGGRIWARRYEQPVLASASNLVSDNDGV